MQRSTKERPFLFWLLALQGMAVVPLLLLAGVMVYQLGARQQAEAAANLQRRVSTATEDLSREADRYRARVELLAQHDAAQAGDTLAMRRVAQSWMASDPSIAGIAAYDGSGQAVFSAGRSFSASSARSLPAFGQPNFFQQDRTLPLSLIPGTPGEAPVLGFATPWRTADGARYTLVMALKPAAFGDTLRQQGWPAAWTAALIDQHMTIAARSHAEDSYVGKPATDSLQRLIRAGDRHAQTSLTKDGTEVVTAVAPVSGTPWWVAAGLPRAAYAEQMAAPLRRLLAPGGALSLLGVAASVWVSKRLNRQMQQVASGRGGAEVTVSELRSMGAQRLMLDNDLVGMVRIVDRRSTWHNPALERIFGYAEGELAGHSPRQMHLDDAAFEAFGQRAYPVIRQGGRYREQLQMLRKDGKRLWVDVSGVSLSDGATLWMILDVTAMRHEHERVSGLAFRDALTGAANRALLDDRLAHALTTARRQGHIVAVCLLDLNGFKAVNDQHGHAAGDEVLRVTAGRLQQAVRLSDTVARMGGDEFVLLLTQLDEEGEVRAVVERVRQALAEPVDTGSATCFVTAAIGTVYFPQEGERAAELLALADRRMYNDKFAHKTRTLEP